MLEMTQRQRNWLPLTGLLLVMLSIFSNALFFVAAPGQKVIPALSVALAVVGVLCAVVGVLRSFRQTQVYGGKVSSSILGVITMFLGLFIVLGSMGMRKLPDSAAAPQPGQKAPNFTLADTNGNKVSMAQLLGKANDAASSSTSTAPKSVLLIFYRGYW